MRSKFAMWSDEGILSKPRTTGFGRVRLIIVVCSVCGIAAASVYSQIGPDRGTLATDRPAGYGTDGRAAQAQQKQTQSSEPHSTIDSYARSGANDRRHVTLDTTLDRCSAETSCEPRASARRG